MIPNADGDTRQDNPLELDGAAFRGLVEAALERLVPLLDGMPQAPASWPSDTEPRIAPLPRTGITHAEALNDLFGRLPAGINTAAPGFLGYIPGGGVPHAAVADLIANVLNRYVGISPPAPHLAVIEREVVTWFATIIGYPPEAGGTLTSGGSGANLIAVAAAREDRFPGDGDDDLRLGTMYVSDQAHHSVMKAARFAGIPARRVRIVPTDDEFRMRPDALHAMIADDRAAGLVPFLLVANGGATNTGAVDPLRALSDIARMESLWFHVDAAYGGFFVLTDRGRSALDGMAAADSVVLDPHKTLFLPYGTGALLVRDPARVARAFRTTAEYLPPSMEGRFEPADLSFELTRPFRALRVWLPFRMHGVDTFTWLLDEKLDLASMLHGAIAALPDVELVAPPHLSTLAFACRVRNGESDEDVNRRTRDLMERINAGREVYVTGTMLRGRFVIRASIVSFRTHRPSVQTLVDALSAI